MSCVLCQKVIPFCACCVRYGSKTQDQARVCKQATCAECGIPLDMRED